MIQNYFRIYPVQIIGDDTKSQSASFTNCYPNPFNSSVRIIYYASKSCLGSIKIYDLLGRELITLHAGQFNTDQNEFWWRATDMPSGVYFYKITTDGCSVAKKMSLVR